MYKRNIQPILTFLRGGRHPGKWYVDAGYGKLYYTSDEISGTINTRTNASGATVIIEVY